MANAQGHPASLEPYREGNTHSLRHGVYSQRVQEPRAREVAEEILAAEHTVPLDSYGALEIGRLVALIDALDAALARGGVIGKHDKVRSVVDLRLRASRRLADWLDRYGMTPKGRAEWARELARGRSLVEEFEWRREQRAREEGHGGE